MKKWNLWMIILLGSLLSFQACDDDDDDDVIAMDSQSFVTEAASGNLLEIRSGNLAAQQGESQAVEDYGAHMVTDHTAASAELLTLATAKGLSVPTDLSARHQQQYNVLTPLAGTAFDKAFMDLMVKSHQEQVDLFERASKGVNDSDLRSFAAGKLPTLKTHLQEAEDLNEVINP